MTAIYRLYRGVDVRDAVAAHERALVAAVGDYDVFNISARSPFKREETEELFEDAAAVMRRHCPAVDQWFARRGWALPTCIDRVYVTEKAERLLGYAPHYDFTAYLAHGSSSGRRTTRALPGGYDLRRAQWIHVWVFVQFGILLLYYTAQYTMVYWAQP